MTDNRAMIECDQCGGSGFDTQGSGYGNVCNKCGGLKEFPAAPDDKDTPFPWEPRSRSIEETVALLQDDFRYIIAHTAVMVHSNNPAMVFTANTQRGQLIPHGEVKFLDGTTVEFQDIGMPQVNAQYMTVQQIASRVWKLANELGLELAK